MLPKLSLVVRVLALLVQLGIPGLGLIADARLERESLAEPTHIESQSHDCDTRGHPQHCALCQFLRTAAVLPGADEIAPRLAASTRHEEPARLAPPSRQAPLPFPRGPPLLS